MEMSESYSKVEKALYYGKLSNCPSRAISPFPTEFSEDLDLQKCKKPRACLGKALISLSVSQNE